jgi:diamine N-acetyltransferase
MISIVPAGLKDVAALAQMGGQTIMESHGHSQPAEVMHSYIAEKFSQKALEVELSDPANIFYLVYYQDQLAGYSKIIYNVPIAPVPLPNITKMERLYLLRAFYDKKLGQQLLQFNIDLSKEQGQAGMWLYVWKGNDRALRFYKKAGFEIVGDGLFRLTDTHANPNWQMFLPY